MWFFSRRNNTDLNAIFIIRVSNLVRKHISHLQTDLAPFPYQETIGYSFGRVGLGYAMAMLDCRIGYCRVD